MRVIIYCYGDGHPTILGLDYSSLKLRVPYEEGGSQSPPHLTLSLYKPRPTSLCFALTC